MEYKTINTTVLYNITRKANSSHATAYALLTQVNPFGRTLSDTRGQCVTAIRQLQVACVSFEARVTQAGVPSGSETSALERLKLKEAMQLQGQWNAEKVALNSR